MAFNKVLRKNVEAFINEIEKNKIKILKAYIYGSYAKGNEREDSDIDLALISPDFSGNRFLDSMKIIPLRRRIDSRIEPVTYKPEDFSDTDPLVAEIKKTGIEVK